MIRLQTTEVPTPCRERLTARGARWITPHSEWEFPLATRDAVTPLIDELRASDVGLYSLAPKEANLQRWVVSLLEAQPCPTPPETQVCPPQRGGCQRWR